MPTDSRAWFLCQLKWRDLTQEAAAREFGVSHATIQRWAGGRTLPAYAELVKINEAWGELPPSLS